MKLVPFFEIFTKVFSEHPFYTGLSAQAVNHPKVSRKVFSGSPVQSVSNAITYPHKYVQVGQIGRATVLTNLFK